MAVFSLTTNPTPFGQFDSDAAFQIDADSMVTFVKRRLGDDILSVELTKKQIWTCFEEATFEYNNYIHQYKLKADLSTLLGLPSVFTGSVTSGVFSASYSMSNMYIKRSMEFTMALAEPYALYGDAGGAYDTYSGYIDLHQGQQDYNIYTQMYRGDGPMSGSLFFDTMPSGTLGQKLRILDVMHFEPLAAQHFLLNASNVTNFLATNFNYESYTNASVFYVLPVFEDVLRRGMLEAAFRVRRSHYSYKLSGRNLRLFPIPQSGPYNRTKLWLRIGIAPDPTNPSNIYTSDSTGTEEFGKGPGLSAINNPATVPYTVVPYININMPGRHWIKEYTLALSKEILGLVRSKFKSIPIPGNDLTLNGDDLLAQSKDEKDKLHLQIKELFDSLTYDKLTEMDAQKAQNVQAQLKMVPIPKPIFIG